MDTESVRIEARHRSEPMLSTGLTAIADWHASPEINVMEDDRMLSKQRRRI